MVDTPRLKTGDFFRLQPTMLASARLTRSPQAFPVSGYPSATILSPSALTFLAAFQSLRWWVRHQGQVHSRSESESSSFLYPQAPAQRANSAVTAVMTIRRRSSTAHRAGFAGTGGWFCD